MNLDCSQTEDIASADAIERIIRRWLEDHEVTVFCGAWSNGAIMELLPGGNASLTGPLYTGRFSGLRDLLLDDGAHHVHLDLGRLTRACYVVLPSVCYGFRPSFELRIAARDADPIREFGLGFALRQPYDGDRLRERVAARYFARVAEDLRAYPRVVSFDFAARTQAAERAAEWSAIEALLAADEGLRPLRAFLPSASVE